MLQNCHALTAEAAKSLERSASLLGLSDLELQGARQTGSIRADWQWSNRGLGGYRRWCAGEGAAIADWIDRLASDPSADPPQLDDGLTPR